MIHAFIPVHCPHCGQSLAGHTSGVNRQPAAGDLAMCWNCRRISVCERSPAGIMLRAATEEEIRKAMATGVFADVAEALQVSDSSVETAMNYQMISGEHYRRRR